MRRVNSLTFEKIKQWEGFVPHAYDDEDPKHRPVVPGQQVVGTLTIGYGHTGPDVKPGDKMTEAQATQQLLIDLQRVETAVQTMVTVDLTDNQFGALVAFVLNIGVAAFRNSTLLKKLNAGDYAAVPGELARWNKRTVNKKKVVSQGLVNRRAVEAGLWATGGFVSSKGVPVAPDTAPVLSKETMSWGAGILGSMGALFTGEGPVQYALAAVVVIGFAVGAWYFIQKRRAA